jgi:hypothetical protein
MYMYMVCKIRVKAQVPYLFICMPPISVADPALRSAAYLTPGSGIFFFLNRFFQDPGSIPSTDGSGGGRPKKI